jgi:glycerol-3-phosphate acyltransferase PlsX
LFHDRVDVVVCDGFVGNIVLKTSESLATAMFDLLKQELTANLIRKAGAWLSRSAFRTIKRRLDPESYGGAPLLGFNGVVLKAHASATARAVASAIRVATENVRHDVNHIIAREIAAASAKIGACEPETDVVAEGQES